MTHKGIEYHIVTWKIETNVSHSWETTFGDQWNDSCTFSKYNFPSMNSIHAYPYFDFNEKMRVKEATYSTQVAAKMVVVKHAKAQRLLQKEYMDIHKATKIIVTVETIWIGEINAHERSHKDVENA